MVWGVPAIVVPGDPIGDIQLAWEGTSVTGDLILAYSLPYFALFCLRLILFDSG